MLAAAREAAHKKTFKRIMGIVLLFRLSAVALKI
jgi:hypothetical protein